MLGEERHAVLLQQPAHLPEPGTGRATGRQRRDLVEVGLLEREHLVHELPVVGHVAGRPTAQPRAPGLHRRQVARVVPQPGEAGLAEEAVGHQPGDLRREVGEGRQRGHLRAARQGLVRGPPGLEGPEQVTHPGPEPVVVTGADGREQRVVLLLGARQRARVDDVDHVGAGQVVEERGHRGVRRAGQRELLALVEAEVVDLRADAGRA